MVTSASDTHPAAARVQLELLRSATPARRAAIALALSEEVVGRSRRALRERMPDASAAEIDLRWVELNYGPSLASALRAFLASRRTG